MQIRLDNNVDNFAKEIKAVCKENVYNCYQCGKCTAGCTVAQFIDESPTQILRLIQLNQRDEVFKSKTPYVCAVCGTCTSRCPMEIDIAKIMETIRIMADKLGYEKPCKEINRFSKVFLDTVRSNGKLFEFGMTIAFNLINKTPFKDAMFGPVMLQKGKLALLPTRVKNLKRIKAIFAKANHY